MLVPPAWYEQLAGQMVIAILVVAVLAIVLALCSEADAFVAASMSTLPLLPRLWPSLGRTLPRNRCVGDVRVLDQRCLARTVALLGVVPMFDVPYRAHRRTASDLGFLDMVILGTIRKPS